MRRSRLRRPPPASAPAPERTPTKSRVDATPLSTLAWMLNKGYCRLVHGFPWSVRDPLPPEGPAIVVCNHLSSVDPFILAASTRRVLGFLIAAEYYHLPVLRHVFDWMGCIPVRRGRQDFGALRKALMALRQGRVLCVFPEGGIERGFDDPHLGASYLSLRTGAPVYPARVEGTPRSESVWLALFTPSRSRVAFARRCDPPRGGPRRPTRGQVAAWSGFLLRTVSSLRP